MHPLNGGLPGPYVPAQVTRGALVAHRYTYAPPSCRTLQYSRTFIPFSVSHWNDLANPVFDGVGLGGFQEQGQCFFIGLSCSIPTIVFYSLSISLLSVYIIIIIITKGRQCKAGRERLTPYQSEDHNPTTPTHRMKEEKGKQ